MNAILNNNKKYQIIYADPPWNYSNKVSNGAAVNHYATMKLKDIAALPVNDLADDDCILFLWATFPTLPDAIKLMADWGFKYKTVGFNWVKANKRQTETYFFGCGNYTRANSEICLIGVKGKPKRISASVSQVIVEPVQKHSKKPDIVRDKIVELMGDLPRIELFARETVDGWDCWGNEV
ncbi:DNA methyltransferase [Pasteurellaceae bacterium USgator11]|nr:DNA methyltransferase [Pasteurellaceae bacterium USgator41]TNG96455.1 DNA methyltransferase [Pasteurellaceae bacterium UScroc12]TNH00463.1 DNA methyltransferase [Pasteurellaceae bacterium UScroc31]TNH01706.1 DNA methyltransferase [Pasteurellaceae bacterium USgator11]